MTLLTAEVSLCRTSCKVLQQKAQPYPNLMAQAKRTVAPKYL